MSIITPRRTASLVTGLTRLKCAGARGLSVGALRSKEYYVTTPIYYVNAGQSHIATTIHTPH